MSTVNDAQYLAPSDSEPDQTGAQVPSSPRISPWVWLLFLAVVNLIGPFLPIPNALTAIFGGITLTIVYIGAVIAFALGIARQKLPIRDALVGLAISALIWFAIEKGMWPIVRQTIRTLVQSGGVPTSAQRLTFVATEALQDLALFCGATFAGSLLARLIRHPNMIGPIGAAIALIDIWGVLLGGIVSQLMTNKATQPIAERAMAAGPKIGADSAARTGYSVSMPAIGVGDFLFIALLLSVLVNLAMNWKSSARLMWVLICFALLSIQFLPFFPALPGLLFIGAAAVLPNWKFFKFTREERFALLYAGIFVLLLTVGLYFGFKSMLPPSK